MILQVNNEWRIVSETNQWKVQRLHTIEKEGPTKGDTDWVTEAYTTRPDSAALWLAERRVRDLPGTYPAADALEALGAALQEIVEDMNRLVDNAVLSGK